MGLFRKRYRVLLFALLVAAFVVPVGFALSIESAPPSAPVVATTVTTVSTFPSVSGSTKLLLGGAALFGLAAAVRRTI